MTKAEQAAGSDATVVTFDLSQEVVHGIQNGDIEFCIDQQPYLQGYEAVDTLWLYLTNGNDLGGGQPVLTGPRQPPRMLLLRAASTSWQA